MHSNMNLKLIMLCRFFFNLNANEFDKCLKNNLYSCNCIFQSHVIEVNKNKKH